MKAFCMDVHISIIADFKSLFPEVEVIDWCLSGHAWVMNRKQDTPKHINPSMWKNLNMDIIRKFQQEYDNFLKTFDFFIVGYASCFAMIYEKYNKPILMMNAVRYDVPFCWTRDMEMLEKYNQCLHRLTTNNKLLITSNNKADQLYLQYGCNLNSVYIPSVCDYTHTYYSPTRDTFLCYHGNVPSHPLIVQKGNTRHQWSDLTTFKGIVSIPYEISLMSLFEQFTMGMPFFFPSKSFWKQHANIQSIDAYWSPLPRYFRNLADKETWIELSDIYTAFESPNTYYFDSFPHLFQLLEQFVYKDDREFRKNKSKEIRDCWKHHLLTYNIVI